MEIQKLQISNMFCFENAQELIFDEPVYQIVGERDGIENQSNGTGKSSLYYAIQEILFGKNVKKTLKEFTGNVFTDPNNYSGAVTFTHVGKEYKVVLARKKGKATLTVFQDAVDISAHTIPGTYKVIEEILGIDYELFTMLTYLSPTVSTPNTIFFGTPKEKKELFTKLFALDDIIKRVDRAKIKAADVSSEIILLKKQVSQEVEIKIPELLAKPLDVDIQRARECIFEARARQKKLEAAVKDSSTWQSLRRRQQQLEEMITELPEYVDNPTLEAECRRYYDALVGLKAQLTRLKLAKELCPTCGRKFDDYEHIKKEIQELQTRVTTGENLVKITTLQLDDLNSLKEAHSKRDTYVKELQDVNDQLASTGIMATDLDGLKHELNNCLQIIEGCSYRLAQLEAEEAEYNRILGKIDSMRQMREQQLVKLAGWDTQITELTAANRYYLNISEHLGFGGYVTAKIQHKAEELTSLINEYLNVFSNGSLIIRLLDSDKLNYKLLKDNRELPTNNLSAGQTTMLQLSSILALRDLVLASKGVHIDLLVLDELFGTLDEIRRTILMETIRNIQGRQKVLSISHLHHDSSIPIITVRQTNGISRIIQ